MQKFKFLHNPPPPPLNVQEFRGFKIEAVDEHSAPSRFDVLLNCYV